jgi:2-haloacid dehalogenase
MTAKTPLLPVLIFDFGGVLIDWDPRYLYRKVFADEQAMERFLAEIGFFEWNKLQDAGRPFTEAVADLCNRHPQHCELIRLYDERYEESLSGPIYDSIAILSRLRTAGYKLYALSNWPQEKFQLIRRKYDFFGWFDALFISGELGLAKPDPRIFRLVLERLSLPADQCLFIDDSAKNIIAARALGFRTIHFINPEQLEIELLTQGILHQ